MALILTRRIHESIMIGDNIKITITGVRGRSVQVAIDAPKEIPVDRDEIYLRKANGPQKTNRESINND